MKRSFCRALCIPLGCVLLLGISACARQKPASSEPSIESQQTEATVETEEPRGEKNMADETTSESFNEYTEPDGTNTKERYIQNEDGTQETYVEKWKDGQKQYDGYMAFDQYENLLSTQEVVNLYDENGALIRIVENDLVQDNDGGITSTNSAEYFQDYEDCLKGYKTKQITKDRADGTTSETYVEEWKDGRKQYDGHRVFDQNENILSMREVMNLYDENGALIRVLENDVVQNDDGGTTLTNSVEYFQDYEDCLKGYKMKQIKKTRSNGTIYEFHGEYTYPDGRYSKAGFTTSANGVRENYSEEWKDGKKVSG